MSGNASMRAQGEPALETLEPRLLLSAGDLLWIDQFGGDAAYQDAAQAVHVAGDGSVYVAGYAYGSLPGQTGVGDGDAFVRKYDADGTVLWTRQFGSSGEERAFGVSADDTGVYVVGETFDALSGSSAGDGDAFIRKYDPDGAEQWTRQFGSSAEDLAVGVSADGSGVYVAGQTYGILPGQTTMAGYVDAFVRKYDADGTELWTRQFGTTSINFASGVSADGSGVYVSGQTDGTFVGQTNEGDFDAFVRKYDSGGTEQWTRQFGTVSSDNAYGVSADGSGVYVVGETLGPLPGQTNAGLIDAFVRRYDADGNEQWTDQFGSASVDRAKGVSANASGAYVIGETLDALPGQTNLGSWDAFVRRYDAAGNEGWTAQFGTTSVDFAYGISAGASGLYATGETYGEFSGQTSAGYSDAFVVRMDIPNLPPVADAGGPYSGAEGDDIQLDASATVDPEDPNTALTFEWDLDYDGAAFDVDATSMEPTVNYPDAFPARTIAVRVTDSGGLTDIATTTLEVLDVTPPVVEWVDAGSDVHSLIVQLNDDDLNPTQAEDVANYKILAANGDANGDGDPFNDGDEFELLIDSVTYDPGTDRITIQTSEPLFDDFFRLEMDGDDATADGTSGITDIAGNFLAGGDNVMDLDLNSLTAVHELLSMVEALDLPLLPEAGLTLRLRWVTYLLEEDVGSEFGLLFLMNSFIRGVDRWYNWGQISLEDRTELVDFAEWIKLGIDETF